MTLDDPVTLDGAKFDPMGFLQDLDKHVIIDEAQRVPELFLSIKKLVDEDRKGRRIILTGSANVMMLPKVADSLAGRIEIHRLWPLSQTEIHGLKSNFLQTLISGERLLGKKSHGIILFRQLNQEDTRKYCSVKRKAEGLNGLNLI